MEVEGLEAMCIRASLLFFEINKELKSFDNWQHAAAEKFSH